MTFLLILVASMLATYAFMACRDCKCAVCVKPWAIFGDGLCYPCWKDRRRQHRRMVE